MPLEYDHTPITVAGKSAVVIGGTSGIGRAIALGFAAEGADVVAASRTREHVERTAEEIRDRGASTVEVTCDATDRESIRSLRDEALDAFGGVDTLVYSPSYIARQGAADATDNEWRRVFDVHLDGAYRVIQLFAEEMVGAVVYLTSDAASYITGEILTVDDGFLNHTFEA